MGTQMCSDCTSKEILVLCYVLTYKKLHLDICKIMEIQEEYRHITYSKKSGELKSKKW